MGRTACTEPQCLYSTAIPLLPLWAVLPVQSLSACTVELYLYSPYAPYCLFRASVPVQWSYTSTPPMRRTACSEPQCLYSRAIPLLPLCAVLPVQSLSACTGCTLPFIFYPSCISIFGIRICSPLSRNIKQHIEANCAFSPVYIGFPHCGFSKTIVTEGNKKRRKI